MSKTSSTIAKLVKCFALSFQYRIDKPSAELVEAFQAKYAKSPKYLTVEEEYILFSTKFQSAERLSVELQEDNRIFFSPLLTAEERYAIVQSNLKNMKGGNAVTEE